MGQQQLLTLSDVARLADVRRPVVSMWRKRSAPSGLAFPAAATMRGSQELFAAAEIAAWLTKTGRGNNPEAALDVAAHAVSTVDDPLALTSLIALQALSGRQLSSLDESAILDLADEVDPDDKFLYSEVESVSKVLSDLAVRARELIDAAYSPHAAMEAVVARIVRNTLPLSRSRVAPDAVDLAAGTAMEVARRMGSGRDVTLYFIDATPGGSDLPMAIMRELGESSPARFGLTAGSASAVDGEFSTFERLAERRLRTHLQSTPSCEYSDSRTSHRAALFLAHYPSPDHPSSTPGDVLANFEELVQRLGAWDSAVVLAPADALTDELHSSAEDPRSRMLRGGRIRAAIRLPEKLMPASPRRAMALWVLGPAHADIPIGDRWTMVADLSALALDTASRQDLISDLSASLGARREIASHAFRFARLVPTSTLLAQGSAMIRAAEPKTPSTHVPTRPSAVEQAVHLETTLKTYNDGPVQSVDLPVQVSAPAIEPASSPHPSGLPSFKLGALISDKRLAYLPGTRIAPESLGKDGIRVWEVGHLDVDAVTNIHSHIDALRFAAEYPLARLTEPGDIVFRTGPNPAAIVDHDGAAVVRYPARILRIRDGEAELLADVIAADINSASGGPWRQWPVRSLTADAAKDLGAVLVRVRQAREGARTRLALVDTLNNLLIDAATAGVVCTINESPTMEGRP